MDCIHSKECCLSHRQQSECRCAVLPAEYAVMRQCSSAVWCCGHPARLLHSCGVICLHGVTIADPTTVSGTTEASICFCMEAKTHADTRAGDGLASMQFAMSDVALAKSNLEAVCRAEAHCAHLSACTADASFCRRLVTATVA